MTMRVTRSIAAIACVALAGCATPSERVSNKEDLLAAAGFDVHPANTLERQDALRRLPPNKFVQQARGDSLRYVYADPLVCNCLYLGDQQAYGRYRQEMLQRQIADQQHLTAVMNQDYPWNESE